MITSLYLHNFKAFDELQAEIRPITLILGPNNSGKSSLIASIRLLVQTIESRDPDVPLLLSGVMGDLGTYKDIVYLNHRGRLLQIGITVSDLTRASKPEDASKLSDLTYLWEAKNDSQINIKLSYKYRTVRRELILEALELKRNHRPILSTKYSDDTERQIIISILGKEVPTTIRSSFARYLRIRNFIPSVSLFIDSESSLNEFLKTDIRRNMGIINNSTRTLIRTLESTDYIGAMRIPPVRLYSYTGERRRRIGAAGENAAHILSMDRTRTGRRQQRIISSVSEWLSKAKIARSG